MSYSGTGVSGSSNLPQEVVSSIDVEKAQTVGHKNFREVSIIDSATNTRGIIRTEGEAKYNVKSPSLRNRLVQKIHQFGKTWIKFSDAQLGMFQHLTDSSLKKELQDSIGDHNNLVDRLDALWTKSDELEKKISQFEKDFGDVLAFRQKNHPSRSDLKKGKSFVYPGEDGEKASVKFTSPDKSSRTDSVREFHDSLRRNPEIKSYFDQYFQNKHDLAICNEKRAAVKQELYILGEAMKPSLAKAIKQLYQENSEVMKSVHQSKELVVNKGFEKQVSAREQKILNKQSEYAEKVDAKKIVSRKLQEKAQKISAVDKEISSSRNLLADFVIKQVKKIMTEKQRVVYFNDSELEGQKFEEVVVPLKTQKEELQRQSAELKEQEDNLAKAEKEIKDDIWVHRADMNGANSLKRLARRKFGVHVPVGRQTGGSIGELKQSKKARLGEENRKLKMKSAQIKKGRDDDLRNLMKVAEGKASSGANVTYSPESFSDSGERGIKFVQNILSEAYTGEHENQWQSDILEIINAQDLASLEIIERNVSGWGADGDEKYLHILSFIKENRKDSAL